MECVPYARGRYEAVNGVYFPVPSDSEGTAIKWWDKASDSNKYDKPAKGRVVCWKHTNGIGHAGFIEAYTSDSKLTFSDANRDRKGSIRTDTDISLTTMKGYFGEDFTLLGYIGP